MYIISEFTFTIMSRTSRSQNLKTKFSEGNLHLMFFCYFIDSNLIKSRYKISHYITYNKRNLNTLHSKIIWAFF